MKMKDPTNPLVSVCIPVYNGASVIEDTIHSLLAQTYENIEFILVDNCSTDNTIEVVQALAGGRMKIIKNDSNIGAANNWSKCVEVAQGEFVAIYHADDVYDPTIVEKAVTVFLANQDIGAVFTAVNRINGSLEKIGEMNVPDDLQSKGSYDLHDILLCILKNRTNPFMCPSFMVKKKIYEKVGKFNNVDFQYAFDLDLYMRIAEVARVGFIGERLVNYRVSKNQGSFKYKVEQTEPGELYVILDRYVVPEIINKMQINPKYLRQYQCQKDTEKYRRAVNLLRLKQFDRAKALLWSSITSARIEFSLQRFSIFRGMIYTLLVILFTYLGLGEWVSNVAYKIDKRKFDRI